MRNESLYVYKENGVVAGSIILNGQQPDEYKKIDWPSQATDEKVNVIHLLMVRPCMTGKGMGSAPVDYALETARQCFRIAVRLDTGEQNTPVVSLHKKLEFQLTATSSMKVGGIISHKKQLCYIITFWAQIECNWVFSIYIMRRHRRDAKMNESKYAHQYDDIINLPHHQSKKRKHMPVSDRAAQFSPFAALTGYDAAIEETARLTDRKLS